MRGASSVKGLAGDRWCITCSCGTSRGLIGKKGKVRIGEGSLTVGLSPEVRQVGTAVVYCPECDARIELQEVKMGEIVECLACGSYLKIVGTDPDELELVEQDD